ncbi:hypothetical protein P5V15_014565 [Pogonomyrmex californicus]
MIIESTVSPVLKIGLQCLGIWPGVPYSTVYWLSFILTLLIAQYFQYSYAFHHLKMSEFSNLFENLIATLEYTMTIFKLSTLWIHRQVLHQILTIIDNDWRECINTDLYLNIMMDKANVSHFICHTALGINVITAAFYLLGDYVISSLFQMESYNDTLRQLPIKLHFPFDVQQSPTFECIFVIICLHIMLHAITLALINGLIFTLVLHASGQIDIICQEFKNISKNVLVHKSSVPLFGILIERHERVILFSDNIEKLFSFIALIQVVWNTLVICCVGFFIIISIHNETGTIMVAKTVLVYIAVTIEIFAMCFIGEYLSFKSESITSSTYDALWYDMPTTQARIILFILMRSQRQITITAGKITDMSFETFTNIMKATVSYISVLNAMH